MRFKDKLRQLREAAGWTEEELARRSGLAHMGIRAYGRGKRVPRFASLVRLARAFDVSHEAFADCKDMAPAWTPVAKRRRK
jgi:transcriptional regulator with XRE-family HTH domain